MTPFPNQTAPSIQATPVQALPVQTPPVLAPPTLEESVELTSVNGRRRMWARSAIVAVSVTSVLGIAATAFAYRGQGQIRRDASQVERDLRDDLATGNARLAEAEQRITALQLASDAATLESERLTQATEQLGQEKSGLERQLRLADDRVAVAEESLREIGLVFPLDYTFGSVDLSGAYTVEGTITECEGFDDCAVDAEVLSGGLKLLNVGGSMAAVIEGFEAPQGVFDGTSWVFSAAVADDLAATCDGQTVARLGELRVNASAVGLESVGDGTVFVTPTRLYGTLTLTSPQTGTCLASRMVYSFDGFGV